MTPSCHELDLADLDFTRIVRPGDTVMWTQGAGEPLDLIARLFEQRHEIGPFRVFLAGSYAASARPEHSDVVSILGLGAVGTNRALCDAGAMEIIPCHLSDLPYLIREGALRPEVVLTQLSSENAQGRFTFGATNGFIASAMPRARVVIAEVNDHAPRTRSRAMMDRELIDVVTRTSRPLVEVASPALGDSDRAIAEHVARFIGDGSIVQLGIGAVPNAVARAIGDRRDLGVHSGVVGEAIVDLVCAGAITNATKPVDAGKSVTGALLGTRRLYDFADGNDDLLVEPVTYTHSHRVLAGLPGLVSINSALEVDLTGQVSAEIAGTAYVGTIGGHADFVRGAMAAEGGRSVIGLPSRTRRGTNRIVARLRSGVVTTSRADADVVATEFGVAELRGQPISERVRRTIAIAHPDDRDALEREARECVVGYR